MNLTMPVRKLRADSVFAALTPEHHQLIFTWLFEENVSLDDALVRIRELFNINPSRSALAHFSLRLRALNQSQEILDSFENCPPVQSPGVAPKDVANRFLVSLEQQLAHAAFQLAQAPPQNLDTLRLRQVITILTTLRREQIRENTHIMEMAKDADTISHHIATMERACAENTQFDDSIVVKKINNRRQVLSCLNGCMRPWLPEGLAPEIHTDHHLQPTAKAA